MRVQRKGDIKNNRNQPRSFNKQWAKMQEKHFLSIILLIFLPYNYKNSKQFRNFAVLYA